MENLPDRRAARARKLMLGIGDGLDRLDFGEEFDGEWGQRGPDEGEGCVQNTNIGACRRGGIELVIGGNHVGSHDDARSNA